VHVQIVRAIPEVRRPAARISLATKAEFAVAVDQLSFDSIALATVFRSAHGATALGSRRRLSRPPSAASEAAGWSAFHCADFLSASRRRFGLLKRIAESLDDFARQRTHLAPCGSFQLFAQGFIKPDADLTLPLFIHSLSLLVGPA